MMSEPPSILADSALASVIEAVVAAEPTQALLAGLERGESTVAVKGLAGSLAACLGPSLLGRAPAVLFVCSDEEAAGLLRDDLETTCGPERIRYFPQPDIAPYEPRSPLPALVNIRIEALAALRSDPPVAVVTTIGAATRALIPPYLFDLATLGLREGGEADFGELLRDLAERGFERVPLVERPGEFAVRGGLIDIFGYGAPDPVRIEFFGDDVESIRAFDVSTQRSKHPLDAVTLPPATEVPIGGWLEADQLEWLQARAEEEGRSLEPLIEAVRSGRPPAGIEHYAGVLGGERATLRAYLPRDAIVLLPDPEALRDEIERRLEVVRDAYAARAASGELCVAPQWVAQSYEEFATELGAHRVVECLPFGAPGGRAPFIPHASAHKQGGGDQEEGLRGPPEVIAFGARSQRHYEGDLRLLGHDLAQFAQEGLSTTVLAETRGAAERLSTLLDEPFDVTFGEGATLSEGFVFPGAGLVAVNDHEIFTRFRRLRSVRKFAEGAPVASVTALGRGDYVVHVDYGIGRFLGLERISILGTEHDCLALLYRDDDRVFVPVEQLGRVQKYTSGDGGQTPGLSKLGTASWERIKERAKQGILDMAEELIGLYAERKTLTRPAWGPDTSLQFEFDAAFPYEETRDQGRTIAEIKRDLESDAPMDRLVCGDVGYGKTEVAMRAAFKVVTEGKQVALLVPTTILAQQHFTTFVQRFADWPVNVEMVSRFRSPKEQRETLALLAEGKVDIVIGTHRLLSKDVRFKSLGLVVIDEEHRFGVRHKERLKQMRRLVDVLSLTATPIPRTLHMGLMGARDMSTIMTPPPDRLSVYTEVIGFDEGKIAEAILREIDREGQVYFVHNRVQTIEKMAARLEELLPQVRFAIAHGQMSERDLERVMLRFLDGDYDCLVASVIIEAGLDIPNANTLIVNRADRFGLAQLYQLRGRVGRSDRRAYAYFVVPPRRSLPRPARRRLRAIEEFCELGSGLGLAMRDLEIRGAGNILGAQQHGFIAQIGFHLYTRLLDEAVMELRGQKPKQEREPEMRLGASGFLPDAYVSDPDQKFLLYARLADSHDAEAVRALTEEVIDRYGRMPPEARALFDAAGCRAAAMELGAAEVHLGQGVLSLGFPTDGELSREWAEDLVRRSPVPLEFDVGGRASDGAEGSIRVRARLAESEGATELEAAAATLNALAQGEVLAGV